jgi:hypothetical protein
MSAIFQPAEPTVPTPIVLRPVDEPNAGARLVNDLRTFLCRFVAFTEPEQADAIALWIAHTHAVDAFDCTPRLSIQSAEKRSGKTRLMDLCGLLVRNPVSTASITSASLFRLVGAGPVTLLVDEIDTVFSARGTGAEDLRGLLNAGYLRGGSVTRAARRGGGVEHFSVFCPVALAGIGQALRRSTSAAPTRQRGVPRLPVRGLCRRVRPLPGSPRADVTAVTLVTVMRYSSDGRGQSRKAGSAHSRTEPSGATRTPPGAVRVPEAVGGVVRCRVRG